ncbi:hypothetical protein Vpro01_00988 [Vibrio proteolyticus]
MVIKTIKMFCFQMAAFLLRLVRDDLTIAVLLDDSQSEYITAGFVARR